MEGVKRSILAVLSDGAAPLKVTREKSQGQPGLAMPWLGYAQMRTDRAVVFVFYRAEHFKES